MMHTKKRAGWNPRVAGSLALWALVAGLAGCTGTPVYSGQEYTLDAGATDRTLLIQTVRGVLTEYHFEIDRVDGRRGVVTTAFKSTEGLASPWDGEQSSLRSESADFVNQHERAVRVSMEDHGSVIVSVVVQRVHRPGWRIETESISSSTHTTIVGPDGRAEAARMVTPIGVDGELARRIGQKIRERLDGLPDSAHTGG